MKIFIFRNLLPTQCCWLIQLHFGCWRLSIWCLVCLRSSVTWQSSLEPGVFLQRLISASTLQGAVMFQTRAVPFLDIAPSWVTDSTTDTETLDTERAERKECKRGIFFFTLQIDKVNLSLNSLNSLTAEELCSIPVLFKNGQNIFRGWSTHQI